MKGIVNRQLFFIMLIFVSWLTNSYGQLTDWPKGASPEEIGLRVAERFIASPHGVYNMPGTKQHIPYFEVCNWYGALTFTHLTGNNNLYTKLVERFLPLFDTDSSLLPIPDHVDYTVFGAIPFEIFLQTKDKKYFELGKYYADKQWDPPTAGGPRVIPEFYSYHDNGFTWQTRLWIDDMYMISLLQAQAFRATGDKKYIERAAKEMVFYLDSLQKPNGLFYHAPDAPFFWGRGNGWMAAGMTELLRVLPKDDLHYETIMKGYKKMMSSLMQYQSENGMWRQLIDDPAFWPETSSTAMFSFAMITGVKNGWLDKKTYSSIARKGWLALVFHINENNEVTDVCEGTGRNNDRQYYMDRKRITGDMHGQAPLLWCASALLREKK